MKANKLKSFISLNFCNDHIKKKFNSYVRKHNFKNIFIPRESVIEILNGGITLPNDKFLKIDLPTNPPKKGLNPKKQTKLSSTTSELDSNNELLPRTLHSTTLDSLESKIYGNNITFKINGKNIDDMCILVKKKNETTYILEFFSTKAECNNNVGGTLLLQAIIENLKDIGCEVLLLEDVSTFSDSKVFQNGIEYIAFQFNKKPANRSGASWYGKLGFLPRTLSKTESLRKFEEEKQNIVRFMSQLLGTLYANHGKEYKSQKIAKIQKQINSLLKKITIVDATKNTPKKKMLKKMMSKQHSKHEEMKNFDKSFNKKELNETVYYNILHNKNILIQTFIQYYYDQLYSASRIKYLI